MSKPVLLFALALLFSAAARAQQLTAPLLAGSWQST